VHNRDALAVAGGFSRPVHRSVEVVEYATEGFHADTRSETDLGSLLRSASAKSPLSDADNVAAAGVAGVASESARRSGAGAMLRTEAGQSLSGPSAFEREWCGQPVSAAPSIPLQPFVEVCEIVDDQVRRQAYPQRPLTARVIWSTTAHLPHKRRADA
jgi:hypothetical protein